MNEQLTRSGLRIACQRGAHSKSSPEGMRVQQQCPEDSVSSRHRGTISLAVHQPWIHRLSSHLSMLCRSWANCIAFMAEIVAHYTVLVAHCSGCG